MIQVILFDVGGTYLDGKARPFVKAACKELAISHRKFEAGNVVFDSAYNKGELKIEEFIQIFFGQRISKPKLKKIVSHWSHNWKLKPEMKKLVSSLAKHYRLGLLSNSDPHNYPRQVQKGYYQLFEHHIMSHELGLLKPDSAIYKIAIRKFGVPASEILFIDDQAACLATGRKLGMKTLRFQSVEKLAKDLQKRGFLPKNAKRQSQKPGGKKAAKIDPIPVFG